MALSRIGSERLIEVINQNIKLSICGDPDCIAARAKRVNQNISAKFMLFPKPLDLKVMTIDSSNNLITNTSDRMLPCFFEESRYLVILEPNIQKALTVKQNGVDISKLFLRQGNLYICDLQFGSEIGLTPIEVFCEGRLLIRLTLEVFPSKLDYNKDYLAMMEELNEEIASIVYQMFSKTYLYGTTKYAKRQTGAEFISILDLIFDKLVSSIDYVVHHFRYNIVNNNQRALSHKAKKASRDTLRYIRVNPNSLVPGQKGLLLIGEDHYTPQRIIENKKTTSNNIFENRFVKYMIVNTIRSINKFDRILKTIYPDAVIKYNLKEKKEKLSRYIGTYFQNISELDGSKSLSLVFQMAPGYQDVYKYYQLLKKGLNLGCDLYTISPKRTHELYEYWCYLKIHNILKEIGYSPVSDGFIEAKNNGLYLSMTRNEESCISYYNGEDRLTLWYNKSYNGLPTNDQRPDIVLQLQSKNPNQNRMYIFDAKYSVETNGETESPKSDDINVMHRYRDAIVSRTGKNMRYKYETFGAYVLFPCVDEEAFIKDKYYRSISEVNIGAFPMLPGSTHLLEKHLRSLIGQTSIEASMERPVMDEYDDFAKFRLENVMVVNVKNPEHIDAYLKHHFYHIPQRTLSSMRFGIEYLAFYQSKKSFGEADAGISYYARIKSINIYTRGECSELPLTSNNSSEPYLRFELDEIKSLPTIKPIQYGTQSVTFTTMYLLFNAENMHELKVRSSFEVNVYKLLRRFAQEHELRLSKKSGNMYVIGHQILEILENSSLRLDGTILTLQALEPMLEYRINNNIRV